MRFCEQIEVERLLQLRHNLFEKLCEERISMSNRELIRRKKRNRVIEDIYIIGNSLVNGLEDKNMRKVLKKESINDDTLCTSDSVSLMKVWSKYVLNLNCTVTVLKMKLKN